MLFSQQSFLVAGLSRSGVAAAEYLLSKGAKVTVFDDVQDGNVAVAAAALKERGCNVAGKEDL